MKIVVLSSYAPSLYYFREEMMIEFINRGHQVIAIAPESEQEWANKFESIGVKYESIKLNRTSKNPITDIISFFSIFLKLAKHRPDKMFVYQAKTIIYGLLAAKILGITNLYVLFGGLGSVFRDKKESLSAKILKMQYRLTVRFANKVFVQNDDDLNELLNEKIVKADNVQIINGSGVNLTKYKKMDLPEGMTFLFVGRLIKDKGIMEYLYAAEKVKLNYPDARFWIVGYFDTNPSAITSDELGKYIERGIVEYLGYKADVYPYLKSCSVFVLPSYHEGTPKSTLEAMATGRPVLTTDVPGCRETVINTENGFLVPSNNVEELAKMMEWFINNQDKLTLMGERSRRICEEKYDVNKVNEVIMNTMNL